MFIYKLFYNEESDLKNMLINKGINIDSPAVNTTQYDSTTNVIIITNDIFEMVYFEHDDIIYRIKHTYVDYDSTYLCTFLSCPKDEYIDKNAKYANEVKRVYDLLRDRFEDDNNDDTKYIAKIETTIYDMDSFEVSNKYEFKNIYDINNKSFAIPNEVYKGCGLYERNSLKMTTSYSLSKRRFEIKIFLEPYIPS